jgi:ATP-dependent exoDNAse (exonuclease V) alpha subunit
MITYDLYTILKSEIGNGSKDLVTRQSGAMIRAKIESDIMGEKEGSIIALNFSGIGIVDYSCADEIVAKLVSRLLGNEYGDKYILLTGLNDNQKENIEVALERKGLAMMAEMRDGVKTLMGSLNNYLRETLQYIINKGKITAKDLSDAMGFEPNTSGTRLLNLHKKRLVIRKDHAGPGSKVWEYEPL